MTTLEALNKLSVKHRAFLIAYLGNGQDATKAALSVGYAKSSSQVLGSALLKRPDVQAAWKEVGMMTSEGQLLAIEEINERFAKHIATIYEVQEFWTKIMRSPKDENGDYVKLEVRVRASELLAKNMGMFIDKIEHTGKDGVELPAINLNFIKSETIITND